MPSETRSHPLRYSAPEGCPGVDGYLGDVDSRATTLELEAATDASEANATSGEEEGVDVRVEPAPDARGWIGHVTIAGPRALDREVRGDRCEDVVAALALITVLRLEGSDASERGAASGGAPAAGAAGATEAGATEAGASEAANAAPSAAPSRSSAASPAPSPEPRSPSASPASPSASAQPATPAVSPSPAPADPEPIPAESASAATPAEGEASAPAPAASAPDESSRRPRADDEGLVARAPRSNEPELPESIGREPAESETSPPSDTPAVAEAEPEAAESRGSWPATSFGVAALGGYATVPSHAFRAALEGELRLGEGTSAWLTSLSFAYARGDHSRAPSDLGLTLLTLELALCPPSFVAEASLWISACASVRGGAVHLAFSATDADVAARDTWRPWLAVGPSLRVGVPLSERWALHGVAQLAVQLVRDTYAVGVGPAEDPGAETVPLYRPAALSLELVGGIGYSF